MGSETYRGMSIPPASALGTTLQATLTGVLPGTTQAPTNEVHYEGQHDLEDEVFVVVVTCRQGRTVVADSHSLTGGHGSAADLLQPLTGKCQPDMTEWQVSSIWVRQGAQSCLLEQQKKPSQPAGEKQLTCPQWLGRCSNGTMAHSASLAGRVNRGHTNMTAVTTTVTMTQTGRRARAISFLSASSSSLEASSSLTADLDMDSDLARACRGGLSLAAQQRWSG